MFGLKIVRKSAYEKLVEEIIPSIRKEKVVFANQTEIDLNNEIKVLGHRLKQTNIALRESEDRIFQLKKELNTMDAKQAKAIRLYDDLSKILIDAFGMEK